MRYSIQPRDRIFIKYYGFLSFAKNMGKNIDNNISKPFMVNTAINLLINLQKE